MKIKWSTIDEDTVRDSLKVIEQAKVSVRKLEENERAKNNQKFFYIMLLSGAAVLAFGLIILYFVYFVHEGELAISFGAGMGIGLTSSIVGAASVIAAKIMDDYTDVFDKTKHPELIDDYMDTSKTLDKVRNFLYLINRSWNLRRILLENENNMEPVQVKARINKSMTFERGIVSFYKKDQEVTVENFTRVIPGINYTFDCSVEEFHQIVKEDGLDFSFIDQEFAKAASDLKKKIARINGSLINQKKICMDGHPLDITQNDPVQDVTIVETQMSVDKV